MSSLQEGLPQTRAPDTTHPHTHGRKTPPLHFRTVSEALLAVRRVDQTSQDPHKPHREKEAEAKKDQAANAGGTAQATGQAQQEHELCLACGHGQQLFFRQ